MGEVELLVAEGRGAVSLCTEGTIESAEFLDDQSACDQLGGRSVAGFGTEMNERERTMLLRAEKRVPLRAIAPCWVIWHD